MNKTVPQGDRAVLWDDGTAIRLLIYGSTRTPLAFVDLAPLVAGRVAGDLLLAMLRRLNREYDANFDALGSFNVAVAEMRERFLAGEPLPPESPFRPRPRPPAPERCAPPSAQARSNNDPEGGRQ